MKLLEWREKENLSMQALADLMGYKSSASVWHFEHGKTPTPAPMRLIVEITNGQVTYQDFQRS